MNKKILIVLFILVIAIICGVVYFSLQPKKDQNTGSNNPNTSANESTNQPTNNEASVGAETYNVSIENFSFKPAELNIKKGDTVIWINQDSMPHKISGNGFQSDTLSKEQSFSFVFNNAGTFDYICSIHPSMKGKIIVK